MYQPHFGGLPYYFAARLYVEAMPITINIDLQFFALRTFIWLDTEA